MSAAWTAVVMGSILGSGGVGAMVWHAARLAVTVERLAELIRDHEHRLRTLERR